MFFARKKTQTLSKYLSEHMRLNSDSKVLKRKQSILKVYIKKRVTVLT